MRTTFVAATAALGLLALAASSHAEGNLAAGPPTDLNIKIATTPNGPTVTPASFDLVTGKYYRANVTFDGPDTDPDWRLEVNDLLANSHLRVLTVNGIEVHLQGMPFRAVEFDAHGLVQFSFVVIPSRQLSVHRRRQSGRHGTAGRHAGSGGSQPARDRHVHGEMTSFAPRRAPPTSPLARGPVREAIAPPRRASRAARRRAWRTCAARGRSWRRPGPPRRP